MEDGTLHIRSKEALEVFANLMVEHGVPKHTHSDNVPGMFAGGPRDWLQRTGAKTAYIEPGSPWGNGYCESLNGRLRNELINGETLYTLKEAQVVIEHWKKHYNTRRPHSALGYRPPELEAVIPKDMIGAMAPGWRLEPT